VPIAGAHGRRIGLTDEETQEYLAGFNYRLGDREREAMQVFRRLLADVEAGQTPQPADEAGLPAGNV